MLPFGIIGVTVLTVVMPRLSRNAAANDTPAVLADLSLATRLTMVTLIPIVAFMTVAGPAIGSALFAYGNFGDVDAGYLGMAITLSAFTLIPYALVLLQLRVFYAREQPWTPIVRDHRHHRGEDRRLAGRTPPDRRPRIGRRISRLCQRGRLPRRRHRRLYPVARQPESARAGGSSSLEWCARPGRRTAASLLAGLIAHVVDQLLGLESLTSHGGGAARCCGCWCSG